MSSFLNLNISNKDVLSKKVAQSVIDQLTVKPDSLICIAGGDTPLLTIQYLIEAHRNNIVDLNQMRLVQLDEWVGLPKDNPGSCYATIKTHLLDHTDIPLSQCHFFDSLSSNLIEECTKAQAFIQQNGGIDLMILGVGVNGHLGFNEPGSKADDSIRVVPLDDTTTTVGKKYFSDNESVSTHGITLGIQEIMNTQYVIIQAFGMTKQSAIKKLIHGHFDINCPVTHILNHKNATVYADLESIT